MISARSSMRIASANICLHSLVFRSFVAIVASRQKGLRKPCPRALEREVTASKRRDLSLTLACILISWPVLVMMLAVRMDVLIAMVVRMDVLIAMVVRMRCGVAMSRHLALDVSLCTREVILMPPGYLSIVRKMRQGAVAAGVLAEDKRFDGHRNGVRG